MSGIVYKTYEQMTEIARKVKFVALFPKSVLKISKLIQKPTYYPELEQKSRKEMWLDNFKWLCKNHELNQYYTSYGLDIRNYNNPDDFISYMDFYLIRNRGNQASKITISGYYNYIVLLRDKYAFEAYLSSTIGKEYIVSTIALISNRQVYWCEKKKWTDIDALLAKDSELVYKVLDGECADGVMLVTVNNNAVYVDDQKYTKLEFVNKIQNQKIIIQNVVRQHSVLSSFGTKSVNTIRIVSIMGKSGAVNILAAFLRLGSSADSFVDNRAKGGLGVGINLKTGTLMKYGFPHDTFGVKKEIHPLSGIRFEGFQLPYWEETVELICNAHKQFYEIQSIGWDVILTETGPILLEGNDDWEISGPQDTYGGLKRKWMELVNK